MTPKTYLEIGLGHGGAGDGERRADVEAAVLLPHAVNVEGAGVSDVQGAVSGSGKHQLLKIDLHLLLFGSLISKS